MSKAKQRPTIKYSSIDRIVDVENPNASVLDTSIAHKIPHLHECGGHGRCTTCRIRILDGLQHVSPPSQKELEISRLRNWDPSIRLACQTRVLKDITIQRLVWSSAEISNLQKETISSGKGDERPLAILFCDMRNFTRLAEKHPIFDLAHMLNRFFTILGDPILMNNGIIYQYVGDEIIGIFGAGGDKPEKVSADAIRAGLGMLYAVQRLNSMELKDFDAEFQVGIGIHFGKAYVGHMGHPKHKQFAVVGDPVNVASRIQDQNKALGTRLLISEDVLNNLPPNTLGLGKVSTVALKGKDKPFTVCEVLGFSTLDLNLEVQATLDIILQNEERFADRFYAKVFSRAPEVRELFKKNMLEQGRMLTHMLGGIVYSLSRPEHLQMGLVSLGQQHERYGVKREHYPVVQQALLETIEEELGDAYTPAILEAWHRAIELVVSVMQEGVHQKAPLPH